MNTPLRMAAFTLGLVAVFGAAVGVGSAVGPVGPAGGDGAAAEHGMASGHENPVAHLPAGLMVTEDGYTLALGTASVPAAPTTPVSFRVLGPTGTR
jgi:hypothetical protein